MAREASEMSVSPAQNFLKPSPVPGPSTVMPTPEFAFENSSATRAEIGSTVDEPEMRMVPLEPSPPPESGVSSLLDAAGGGDEHEREERGDQSKLPLHEIAFPDDAEVPDTDPVRGRKVRSAIDVH